MDVVFPTAIPLRIRFENLGTEASRFFAEEYRRFTPTDAHPGNHAAALTVRCVEAITPTADSRSPRPGLHVADDTIVFSAEGSMMRLTAEPGGRLIAEFEPGAPLDAVRHRCVLASLALLAPAHEAALIHGSATQGEDSGLLLLGGKGIGKTTLLAALAGLGQSCVGDDRLLLGADGTVSPALGRLELRLDLLESDPTIGHAAAAAGWRRASRARRAIRALRRLIGSVPLRVGRQVAGALLPVEEALDSHCFFVEPELILASSGVSNGPVTSPRAVLLSRGSRTGTEPAAARVLVRWLTAEADHAGSTGYGLVDEAARLSDAWAARHDAWLAGRSRIVASAANAITASTVVLAETDTPDSAARTLMHLLDRKDS